MSGESQWNGIVQVLHLKIETSRIETNCFALPCMRIGLRSAQGVEETSRKLQGELTVYLLSAEASFEHIGLAEVTPEVPINSVVQLARGNPETKGLVIVVESDELSADPLEIVEGNDTLPIVLIKNTAGRSLIKDVSCFVVKASLVRSSEDLMLPQYKGVGDCSKLSRFLGRTKLGFEFTKQLNSFLLDTEDNHQKVHTDSRKLIGVFNLFENFDIMCEQKSVDKGVRRKKLEKMAQLLQNSVKATFVLDFPFHLLMSWRLLHHPLFSKKDDGAVFEYWRRCDSSLNLLDQTAVKTILSPFLKSVIVLPWFGKPRSAVHVLHDFFCHSYNKKASAGYRNCNQLKDTIEAGLIFAMLSNRTDGKTYENFWKSVFTQIDPNVWLPSWDSQLRNTVSSAVQLSFALELPNEMAFGVEALCYLVEKLEIFDFGKIKDVLAVLLPLFKIDCNLCCILSRRLRDLLQKGHSRLVSHYAAKKSKKKSLVMDAGSFIYYLHELHRKEETHTQPMSAADINKELEGWIDLVLSCLDCTEKGWPSLVGFLNEEIPDNLGPTLKMKVNDLLTKNVKDVRTDLFVDTIKYFPNVPQKVIEMYLFSFAPPNQPTRLVDSPWEELFNLISKRSWESLKPALKDFLQRLASSLSSVKETFDFYLDCLKLSHPAKLPYLLSIDSSANCEADSEYLLSQFRDSLLALFQSKEQIMVNLREKLLIVLDSLGERGLSPFRETLLRIYIKASVSRSDLFEMTERVSVSFIDTVVEELRKSVAGTIESPSVGSSCRREFLWAILSEMVSHIHWSNLTFTNPLKSAETLGGLCQEFWPSISVEMPGAVQGDFFDIPQGMAKCKKWFLGMKSWINAENDSFRNKKATVKEFDFLHNNRASIIQFCQVFDSVEMLVSYDDILNMYSDWKRNERKLFSILYFPILSKWIYIFDALRNWKLSTNFDYSSKLSCFLVDLEDVTENNTPKACFIRSTALSTVQEVLEDIESFLAPLKDLSQLLCHFVENKSVLFDVCLKRKIETACSQDLSLTETPVTKVVQASHRQLTLETFRDALAETRGWLTLLIQNKACFADIDLLGIDLPSNTDFGLELRKIALFPEMNCCADSKAEQGIIDMLMLSQYSDIIQAIVDVCEKNEMAQCVKAPQFLELKEIASSLKRPDVNRMLSAECSKLKGECDKLLTGLSEDKLSLFFEIKECEEFLKFVKENEFYTMEGRQFFDQQIALLTDEYQGNEYKEKVLDHLTMAFACILPFCDPQVKFVDLLKKLGDSDKFRRHKWIDKFSTVNHNMTFIRLWFATADDVKVNTELSALLENGQVQFLFNKHEGDLIVRYFVQGRQFVTESQKDSPRKTWSPPLSRWCKLNKESDEADGGVVRTEICNLKRQMALKDLEDFARRLQLVENRKDCSNQENVRLFQRRFSLFQKIFHVSSKLFKFGYCDDFLHPFSETDLDQLLEKRKEDLRGLNREISNMREVYPELLFFNLRESADLFHVLSSMQSSCSDELIHFVSRIFDCQKENSLTFLKAAVSDYFINTSLNVSNGGDHESSLEMVGRFLQTLRKNPKLQTLLCPRISAKRPAETKKGQVVHLAYGFSLNDTVRLILELHKGFPECYEILRCHKNTSLEELQLCFERVKHFPMLQFTLVEVDQLPANLQEEVIEFQSLCRNVGPVNYIYTKQAVFREAPWVTVICQKEDDLPLNSKVSMYFTDLALTRHRILCPVVVYGRVGDGKSHYIKKTISKSFSPEEVAVIPVHEAFSPLSAIRKLQKFNSIAKDTCIYFNFTATTPFQNASSDKDCQFECLLNEFSWFFFSLLGMGFVEDFKTGEFFRFCRSFQTHMFVEVPSLEAVSNKENLATSFLEKVPLKYCHLPHEVSPDVLYDTNSDVQLVCKYLNAYNKTTKGKKEIDQILSTRWNSKPIKLSDKPNLPNKECHKLLTHVMKEHLPQYKQPNKISQHLFVKYMKRRCQILDNSPDFIYNMGKTVDFANGKGDPLADRLRDSRRLGSTLMFSMLREVAEMCSCNNWGETAHHQLVYDFKGHSQSPSFRFFSLKPESLGFNYIKQIELIGIKVPDYSDLEKREYQDELLSAALGIKLAKGRLTAIDKEKYVLTPDFAFKMLSIHERRECGVPVVIEGETGVGKTALVCMLSRLWNQASIESKLFALYPVSTLLEKRIQNDCGDDGQCLGEEVVEATSKLIDAINGTTITDSVTKSVFATVCQAGCADISKALLKSIDDSIPDLMHLNQSLKDLIAETRSFPTAENTTKLFFALFPNKPVPTFFKLSVHSALKPCEILYFVKEKIDFANELSRTGIGSPPTVVIFFDEINTSSCMGIFKEIMIDSTVEGEPIPDNLFVLAACNPHRGSSTTISHSSNSQDWLSDKYYVRPLSPTLKFLCWNYGALDSYQEHSYIKEKIKISRSCKEMNKANISLLSELIHGCQEIMRQFAFDQLRRKSLEFTERQAELRSKTCVSQRDIQRVFTLSEFFQKICESPKTDQFFRRCLLVAIGVVYYLRLDAKYRKKFITEIEKCYVGSTREKFLPVFESEVDTFVNRLHLPPGIAKTKALKENLFSTVVCTTCRIPLMIIGASGSSKTLSFNLALANLKGEDSRQELFRNIELFPALTVFRYQCSRLSTSPEIKKVFERAISRQNSNVLTNCVVFMDEAGLPEERHESLKILHHYLDVPEVSFVAISNYVFDAAKSNRAINIFRPETDLEDIQVLAKECINLDGQSSEDVSGVVEKACDAYLSLMKMEPFRNFYGLRDFVHFCRYIRRHRDKAKQQRRTIVLRALQRNFGGLDRQHFSDLASHFFMQMDDEPLGESENVDFIPCLKESISEKTLPLSEHAEAEVRYKLIIDPTKDESASRLLFQYGLLPKASTKVFSCVDFPGDDDSELRKVQTISSIQQAAFDGRTVILSQTEDINDSFYDLYNQRFRRINDRRLKDGPCYYTNIAIGSHSKLCRVNPHFQCLVHMKESELQKAPIAFLSRFEKFRLFVNDFLQDAIETLPDVVRIVVLTAKEGVFAFQEAFGRENFYGWTDETVNSLLLSLLPSPGRKLDEWHWVQQDEGSDDEDTDIEDSWDSTNSVTEEEWKFVVPQFMRSFENFLSNAGFSILCPLSDEQSTLTVTQALSKLSDSNQQLVKKTLRTKPSLIAKWTSDACRSAKQWTDVPFSDKTFQSFAIFTFVEWIVHYACCRFLRLATPEAIILRDSVLPTPYFRHYIDYQSHFSLKKLISRMIPTNGRASVTKTICYTRNVRIDQGLSELSEYANVLFTKNWSFEICKLEQFKTVESLKSRLLSFLSGSKAFFLLTANMDNSTSLQRVNHARWIIDKEEMEEKQNNNFIFLLYFPPRMPSQNSCYPALFLQGWDFVYLDQIEKPEHSLVDVHDWLKAAYLDKEEALLEKFQEELLYFISLPETINSALSRVKFGKKVEGKKYRLNTEDISPMDRSSLLCKVLADVPGLKKIICKNFAYCWSKQVVLRQLKLAAKELTSFNYLSLNLSKKIEDLVERLLTGNFASVLFQLNQNYNFEFLFEDERDKSVLSVKEFFLRIFDNFPKPRLEELSFQQYTFEVRQPRHSCGYYFPFFVRIAETIDRQLDTILIKIRNEALSNYELFPKDKRQGKWRPLRRINQEKFLIKAVNCLSDDLQNNDTETRLVAVSLSSMAENEHFWQCYWADFARTKLCNVYNPGSTENNLLYAWICPIKEPDFFRRIATLHVVTRLRRKAVGLAVAAIRPLEALKDLGSSGFMDLSDLCYATEANRDLKFEKNNEFLYGSVVKTMFNFLTEETTIKAFQSWCKVYSNVSSFLTTYVFHKAKYRNALVVIHSVFVFVQSLGFDNQAFEAGRIMCEKMVQDQNNISEAEIGIKSITLETILETGLDCFLPSSHIDKKRAFVSDILMFHFPSLSTGTFPRCNNFELSTLLKIINVQTGWFKSLPKLRGATSATALPVAGRCYSVFSELVDFKLLQNCLFQVLLSSGDTDQRTGFNWQIRHEVGNFLTVEGGSDDAFPYIPVCYPTSHKGDYKPLMSLYFHCCMQQFQQRTRSKKIIHLSNLLSLLKDIDNESPKSEASVKQTLCIERQALVQMIIAEFASTFVKEQNRYAIDTKEINIILDDETYGGGENGGHYLTFLHHILTHLKSERKLRRLFATNFDAKCGPYPWMTAYKHLGKVPTQSSWDCLRLPLPLQYEINGKLKAIAKTPKKCSGAVLLLEKYCEQEIRKSDENKYHVRMLLVLGVYKILYEKGVSCEELANAFSNLKSFKSLSLGLRPRAILACFADVKRSIRQEELFNPNNPKVDMLKQYNGQTVYYKTTEDNLSDPIWELFNPADTDKQDIPEVDLRRSLVYLAAVAVGLADKKTHLWTHMFFPRYIKNTYVCGNILRLPITQGQLLDYGCLFTQMGDYGRSLYCSYGVDETLRLSSRHYLLWMNFGAFVMALLTQRQAHAEIQGHVISEWHSVRHYCVQQVRNMWSFLAKKLELLEEERNHFVLSGLNRFLEINSKKSHFPEVVFPSKEKVNQYESRFHKDVFLPTLRRYQEPLDATTSHGDSLLAKVKKFGNEYPKFPSYEGMSRSLEYFLTNSGTDVTRELTLLVKFIRQKDLLFVGGRLLPDLIEFYWWLHEDLSHLLTFNETKTLTIGEIVDRVGKLFHYSKAKSEHIERLFRRVKGKYNKFVEIIQGSSQPGYTYGVSLREDVSYIEDSTLVYALLSNSEEEGPDALFVVIQKIINTHNEFVEEVSCRAHRLLESSKFPPVEIQPLEIGPGNCLLAEMKLPEDLQETYEETEDNIATENSVDLLKLIESHHKYVPGRAFGKKEAVETPPEFDFFRLQQSIVDNFFAGKPRISNLPHCIRRPFQYKRVAKDTRGKSGSFLEVKAVDLESLKAQLLKEFQENISSDLRLKVEIEFHDLRYEGITNAIKGLQIIVGHLNQMVLEFGDCFSEKYNEIKGYSIEVFWIKKCGGNKDNIASQLGLTRLKESQVRELLEMPMSNLYCILELLSEMLEKRYYEFAHLPLTLKKRLSDSEVRVIEGLPEADDDLRSAKFEVTKKLWKLDEVLCKTETYMKEQPQQPLAAFLADKTSFSKNDFPISQIPDSIRVEHYVRFRMILRSVLTSERSSADSKESQQSAQLWLDNTAALKENFPHLLYRSEESNTQRLPKVDVNTGKMDFDSVADTDGSSTTDWEKEKDVDSMTVEEVALFVSDAGFPQYADTFRKEKVNGHKLDLDKSDLNYMNVSGLDCVKLLTKFKILRKKENNEGLAFMTVDDVAAFVTESGYEKIASKIKEEHIDGRIFQNLDKEDLGELGLVAMERNNLLEKIRKKGKISSSFV